MKIKNYTFQSVSDKSKTHEGVVTPTRADFVSLGTAFNKKTPLFFFEEVGVFPNLSKDKLLLKADIMSNSEFGLKDRNLKIYSIL